MSVNDNAKMTGAIRFDFPNLIGLLLLSSLVEPF